MTDSMGKTTVNGGARDVSTKPSSSNILDIRSDATGIELRKLIIDGLNVTDGAEKTLPTMLLYDEKGLRLFQDITYLDEYYLTGSEIEVLEKYADRLASRIPDESMIVELGSGNLRKVKILLDALERMEKHVTYYALDLMQSELERTLALVPDGTFKHVQCYGLWGTYDDGLDWLQRPDFASRRKVILSLGSSIGNFTRDEAAPFLKNFADALDPADMLLIGLDACQQPERVFHAYNDRDGVTHKFIMNGLAHANRLLQSEAFDMENWVVIGEYDETNGRHQAFVSPKSDTIVEGVSIARGERVRIEQSYKYNSGQATELWAGAGLRESASWTDMTGTYGLHVVQKPKIAFPTKPLEYVAHPVPTLDEWSALWSTWDTVTRQMIPTDQLKERPIDLRNPYIFYLGHMPTFLDMKLVEATTNLTPTEPKYFTGIFERGIDPDVDEPTKCHAHSETPNDWPDLKIILEYQTDVRKRVHDLYKNDRASKDAWVSRALWLGFEHEAMHLETLLYMCNQSDAITAPADIVAPDFEQLAAQARRRAVPNEWFDIPAQHITIGLDDPDESSGPVRHFGWDVEKPSYEVKVPAIKAHARAITNGEYALYLNATNNESIPASWVLHRKSNDTNGVNGSSNGEHVMNVFVEDKAVRTVYGPVPLKHALDWPVAASYEELQRCAEYMGGRIPTMEEAQSIYEYAALLKKKQVNKALEKTIPAVNGHLSNGGVQISPPATHSPLSRTSAVDAIHNPNELYVDLNDANVGFKNWHPMPIVQHGDKLAGQAEMGGLWEWTSSVLRRREGFVPMKLYPAYSADFYDEKHNVVLGGSWATHPRIAGRKTFVNWYQRNYPYVWATARLVKDA